MRRKGSAPPSSGTGAKREAADDARGSDAGARRPGRRSEPRRATACAPGAAPRIRADLQCGGAGESPDGSGEGIAGAWPRGRSGAQPRRPSAGQTDPGWGQAGAERRPPRHGARGVARGSVRAAARHASSTLCNVVRPCYVPAKLRNDRRKSDRRKAGHGQRARGRRSSLRGIVGRKRDRRYARRRSVGAARRGEVALDGPLLAARRAARAAPAGGRDRARRVAPRGGAPRPSADAAPRPSERGGGSFGAGAPEPL